MAKTEEDYYDEGYRAYHNFKEEEDCPYVKEQLKQWWLDGHQMACEEEQEEELIENRCMELQETLNQMEHNEAFGEIWHEYRIDIFNLIEKVDGIGTIDAKAVKKKVNDAINMKKLKSALADIQDAIDSGYM